MTNRQLFILGWLCALSLNVSAAPRTVNDAMNEANKFISRSSTLRSDSKVQLAYTCPENAYYIFNCSNDEGFVIISGDDRAKTVLGYTENGYFDLLALSDNFRYWLSCYENELKILKKQEYLPEVILQSSQTHFQSSFASYRTPLIKTKWDQTAPFNALCPTTSGSTRAVTGCVATAMAQVMKYYEYPDDSYFLSKSYVTTTLGIPINLSVTGLFDWANMSDVYTVASSPESQTAVATLMYHCGVSVEMDYDKSSGAYDVDVPYALWQVFNYDKNMQIYYRDYFRDDEWKEMIMNELNVDRPVFYSGVSPDGSGHAFLCDGYDEDGFFHFNWGWRGTDDGYFELSALDPRSMGAGKGFNSDQSIITGIQKPNAASTAPPPQLVLDDALSTDQPSVGRDQRFAIIAKTMWNLSVHDFSGYIGIGLCDTNDEFVYLGYVPSIQTLERSSKGNTHGWSGIQLSLSLPNTVPNGNYRLYYIYSTDISTDIVQSYKVKAPINIPSYLDVSITSDEILFALPTHIQTPSASVANTISVYPNPADKELFVQSPEFVKNITVFDMFGKKWMVKSIQASNTISIPVANLPSGQYIIQIETDSGFITKKIMKR